MQTLTIHIDGMTCGGCVKSATNALLAVNGVAEARVSLENKNAEIRFDQQGDGEGVEYHGGYRQKFTRKAEFGSIGQCNMPALFYIICTGDNGRSAPG